MRDIFSEGLLYLDLLELYGNTYTVGDICSVAQSNVFRGATACAKLLSLDLTKNRKTGIYSISKNRDVQLDLRRVNQRLRVRESGQIRVLPSLALSSDLIVKASSLLLSLPPVHLSLEDRFCLLQNYIVDLLFLSFHEFTSSMPWTPPEAKSELFSPCNGLVASVVGQEDFVFLASNSHALSKISRPLVFDDFHDTEVCLLPDPVVSAWQQSFVTSYLPSTAYCFAFDLPNDFSKNVSSLFEHYFNCQRPFLTIIPSSFYNMHCLDNSLFHSLRLPTRFKPPRLTTVVVAMPSLVREPLFQQLMKAFRDSYSIMV